MTNFLSRLMALRRERRAWKADHSATWPPASAVGFDGTSSFERLCDQKLRVEIANRGLTIVEIVRTSEGYPYISYEVPGIGARIFVYNDQVEIATHKSHLILEQWDTRTPDEMVARATTFLRELPAILNEGAA